MAARRPSWRLVLAVVVLAAATTVVLHLTGVVDLGALTDPDRVRSVVEGAGWAGPLVFVAVTLAMHVAQVGGFSTLVAVAIWPAPVAAALCWTGALLSALMVIGAVRRTGRDWAQQRVPPGLRRLTERLEARPATTVLLSRTFLHINFGLDCVLALSRIRFRTLVIFTAVGLVPSTVVNVAVNTVLISVAGQVPWWGWVVLGAVVVVALAAYLVRRRRRPPGGPQPAPGDARPAGASPSSAPSSPTRRSS